jgi:hypothetical protein
MGTFNQEWAKFSDVLICLDCGEILDHCQCEKHDAPVNAPFPPDLDCGPFENAREAYLWMRDFSGNVSQQLRHDPNFHRQKQESEILAAFFEANHSIHLAAQRCASVCKFTLKQFTAKHLDAVNNDVYSESFEEDFKAQLAARGHRFPNSGGV